MRSKKLHIPMRLHSVLFFLLLSLSLLSVGCSEQRETTATKNIKPQPVQPAAIVMDLGEIRENRRKFFPEERVGAKICGLISIPISQAVSNVSYEDVSAQDASDGTQGESRKIAVSITLLPVKSRLGKVISGMDLLENIKSAYEENADAFSAGILESGFDALDVRIVFDREIDFEKEFFHLPLYPSSYLDGTDNDSFGDYLVIEEDAAARKIELYSDTASEHRRIILMHSDFETARKAYMDGNLDILYLPRQTSAKLWAETVSGTILKMPPQYIYMIAFGPQIPMDARYHFFRHIHARDFIRDYLSGGAEITDYLVDKEDMKRYLEETVGQGQQDHTYTFLCFVDAEWSYRLAEYLKKTFEDTLTVEYTDFRNMLETGKSDSSSYVYAFAWDISKETDLSVLLGENFGGVDLDESEKRMFLETLPVIPFASPSDDYLIRHEKYKIFIGGE